jgi:hypothetical protein
VALCACTHSLPDSHRLQNLPQLPKIVPDYVGVTVPPNIAPLNFRLDSFSGRSIALFEAGGEKVAVKSAGDGFHIPAAKWRRLLQTAQDGDISVTVMACRHDGKWNSYRPFSIHVAPDSIDPYIACRIIAPGYEYWGAMGIYQRNLETFAQTPVLENRMLGGGCMNCHSFCMQNPDLFMFHLRSNYAGTFIVNEADVEKLSAKTDRLASNPVYPSWHPSGKFIAFSVNVTKQDFHTNNPNRIEVYDMESDVVVYDVERQEYLRCPQLLSRQAFETFPAFSPDGATLYFCTAAARSIPKEYRDVHYSLCSIAFNPETRTFGATVDTLYNARVNGKSVSFPRVSPDGKFLVFTLSEYGNFSIWHKDADLYIIDLQNDTIAAMDALNSPDVESYHSWSSNSRWLVFSSRRLDGLYTRPFIAHIDAAGHAAKPFLLPQKNTDYYDWLMQSYNIPEFIKGKVQTRGNRIAAKVKQLSN